MNIAIFIITMIAGIFAIGFALGEAHVTKRLKAEADCPTGKLYRKVVDLKNLEVRCHYYATPGEH